MVNKSKLIENIARLVKLKKLEGISDLRDESDRDGMRIVLELKKDTVAGVVLNNLYKHTQMQTSFGIILLSLVNGQPRVLTLKQMLQYFIDHRRDVVTRRCIFELRKAEERAHILEGLKIALDHIDEVIKLIRASKTGPEAKEKLIKRFEFTDRQAQAILDMRLQRLTGLERQKIIDELMLILKEIKRLKSILADQQLLMEVIVTELRDILDKYGDERRTEIQLDTREMSVEDLIVEEDMVVTVSHSGYIKRNAISLYRAQHRGGKGKKGMTTKAEDLVTDMFVASTHDTILIFSDKGVVYWLKVHQIPQAGRAARGKAIVNLVQMKGGERPAAILPLREYKEGYCAIFATKRGVVKKTAITAYSNARNVGTKAINLDGNDELIDVRLTDGSSDILLSTRKGKSIRFKETDARTMGRVSRGVCGIKLAENDEVVGLDVLSEGATILTVTVNGYGKRTRTEDYRVQKRGGRGIITIKTTERNGEVLGVKQVTNDDDVMMITNNGVILRMNMKGLSVIGRNTQGVRLMKLGEDDQLGSLAKLAERVEKVDSPTEETAENGLSEDTQQKLELDSSDEKKS